MTRSEIRDRILSALNDSTSSPVFWSTTEINELIDEAGEVLAEEMASIKRTRLVALRQGATYYNTRSIGTDIMAPYRIWLPHRDWKLTAVTMTELDERNRNWLDVSGNPEVWFGVSWDLFGIYPRAAAGGGLMRVDYLAWPRVLMDDGDEPEFPEPDHDGMVLYGVYEGFLKQWDFESAVKAFAQFLALVPDGKARGKAEIAESRPQSGEGTSLTSGVFQ